MSHFAFVNLQGTVEKVIVAEQDVIDSGLFGPSSSWIQTSYNTYGGVHYGPDRNPDSGIPLRKNYAAVGYTYDLVRDAFIAPQPYPSWYLDEQTCLWEPPVPHPNDGKMYEWDEATLSWIEVSPPPAAAE